MGCGRPGGKQGALAAVLWVVACRPDPASLGNDDGDTTGSGSTGDTTSGGGSSTGDPGARFDVGDTGGTGNDADGCGCPVAQDYPYLWIANMADSTVSKIDTRTVREVARYTTHPQGSGFPSRTAVSLSGRRASVANRGGGLMTIWSDIEDCVDRNQNGIIETSAAPGEVLPWGTDECVAWYGDYGLTASYPVTWTCDGGRELIWTGGVTPRPPSGTIRDHGDPEIRDGMVLLVDGTSGAIQGRARLEDMASDAIGPYVGTVDADGDLWTLSRVYTAPRLPERGLFRVSLDDLTVTRFDVPPDMHPYSVAADADGNVWLSSYLEEETDPERIGAGRLDPTTGEWTLVRGFHADSGLTMGPGGQIWLAPTEVDAPALGTVNPDASGFRSMPATADGVLKGIAVDDDGAVWAHDRFPGNLYKFDPSTGAELARLEGFVEPYTHSDMGGWGLRRTLTCPSRPAG